MDTQQPVASLLSSPTCYLHCEVNFQLVTLHAAALATSPFRSKLLLWSLLNCRKSSIALVQIFLLLLSVLSETFLNPPGGTGLQVLNTSIVFILPSSIHLIDSVRPHMIRHTAACTPLLLGCFPFVWIGSSCLVFVLQTVQAPVWVLPFPVIPLDIRGSWFHTL